MFLRYYGQKTRSAQGTPLPQWCILGSRSPCPPYHAGVPLYHGNHTPCPPYHGKVPPHCTEWVTCPPYHGKVPLHRADWVTCPPYHGTVPLHHTDWVTCPPYHRKVPLHRADWVTCPPYHGTVPLHRTDWVTCPPYHRNVPPHRTDWVTCPPYHGKVPLHCANWVTCPPYHSKVPPHRADWVTCPPYQPKVPLHHDDWVTCPPYHRKVPPHRANWVTCPPYHRKVPLHRANWVTCPPWYGEVYPPAPATPLHPLKSPFEGTCTPKVPLWGRGVTVVHIWPKFMELRPTLGVQRWWEAPERKCSGVELGCKAPAALARATAPPPTIATPTRGIVTKVDDEHDSDDGGKRPENFPSRESRRYPFLMRSSSIAICSARSGNLLSKFWRKALLRAVRAAFLADALLAGLERELVVVIAASTSELIEWEEDFPAKLFLPDNEDWDRREDLGAEDMWTRAPTVYLPFTDFRKLNGNGT
ncbi:hypothetical protein C8F04DRAFT_1304623 [Mycena alexandri]|uniref:Uncharacterized protein n=1 Tax=Mycena alexandri TaxID=1745969 RepID=A0AAD6S9B3_9AGAR|nr:hypothetical protein C8F04DRAFT_1304623 [Mycena alexandri]